MQLLQCRFYIMMWIFGTSCSKYTVFQRKLPSIIVPLKYDITLKPSLNEDFPIFLGKVKINFLVLKATNTVILHSVDLKISKRNVRLKDTNGYFIKILQIKVDPLSETRAFIFENRLEQGKKYNLIILYSGALRNDNRGFYLGKYQELDKSEKLFVTTFFSKQNARLAFPCFDEPDRKAQFTIKLIRPENYNTISNEEMVSSQKLENGYFMDVFKETCNMSTYLVAFTISQFSKTNKNGLHQVFAKPQLLKEGKVDYTLKRSSHLLKAAEAYLNMKYSLSKIAHVAFPNEYFVSEALENWGHISYNERTLSFSNKTSTSLNEQTTVTSIIHELIHHWFGNLVTPSNWKYLWLSEGFATYLQFRIGDLVEPSWKLLDQFQNIIMERAFEGEAFSYATALNDDKHVWVSYLKAACIIRMMEHFLTPNVFRRGLQYYLQNNQYTAVKPLKLYLALQSAIGGNSFLLGFNNVTDIMSTWDSAESYPYVNVTRNYENGCITFVQNAFTSNPTVLTKKQHLWYIPINYVFSARRTEAFDNTTTDFWLTEKYSALNDAFPTSGWLIVNKQYTGYYRVMYDMVNWNRLISVMNGAYFCNIHILNRAQLISDAFDFARTGNLNYAVPLNLIEFLNTCLSASDVYSKFRNYIFNILENINNDLSYNESLDDTHLEKLNRVQITRWMCSLGNLQCSQAGLSKLRNWMINKINIIPPNLQEPLLCGALRIANETEWDFVFNEFLLTKDSVIRNRMLNALSCSEDKKIIRKFLGKIKDTNSGFTYTERSNGIISVLESGSVGLEVGTTYIKRNLRKLWKLIHVENALNSIGRKTTTKKQYDELIAFKNQYIGLHMEFRHAVRLAEINLEWKSNHLAEIEEWFNYYEAHAGK